MDATRRQRWLGTTLLAGALYFLIGRGFAAPVTHAHAWRLAAWVVSGAVFAAHIVYEHFRLRSAKRALASHAALAVAIGAFGLAVAGALHTLRAGSALRATWVVALLAFPLATAVPAFLVAFAAGAALARGSRGAHAE